MEEQEREINHVIGENIERYIYEKHVTKSMIKRQTGIDGKRFNLILKGEVSVTTKKLQEIARILEVKTLDLLEDWSEG